MKLPELPPCYELAWDDTFEDEKYWGWTIYIRGEYYDGFPDDQEGIKDREEAIDECWDMWFSHDLDECWRDFVSHLISEENKENQRDFFDSIDESFSLHPSSDENCKIYLKEIKFGPMTLDEMLEYDSERDQPSSEEVISCIRDMYDKPHRTPLYLGDLVEGWVRRFDELRTAAGLSSDLSIEDAHKLLLEKLSSH